MKLSEIKETLEGIDGVRMEAAEMQKRAQELRWEALRMKRELKQKLVEEKNYQYLKVDMAAIRSHIYQEEEIIAKMKGNLFDLKVVPR